MHSVPLKVTIIISINKNIGTNSCSNYEYLELRSFVMT